MKFKIKERGLVDSIKCLINENGFCFICKKSILDHTETQVLECCDKVNVI